MDDLQHGLLVALDRVVPSDWLSVNFIGAEPTEHRGAVRPPLSQEQLATFAQYVHENPIAARYARTRDSRPYRLSELISAEDFHQLDLYKKFYGPLGVEYQIAFIIQTSPNGYVAIALCRHDRDYDDRERDILDRARPYLIQIYRNALAYDGLRAAPAGHRSLDSLRPELTAQGLTARTATVMSHVAHGRSNADIAADLEISERTVAKHLERCYRILGVSNRSQASARAWELGSRASVRPH